nr:PTS fructose transporter subunit IIC [Clostridioides difficile]
FKNRFTKEERDSGKVNYVMGLSFVTEGAIPFAAGDPLHVIPACVGGSAVAGALSMLFNATLRAPHGGVFVIPVVTHPFAYILAIAVGALVGMMLLALLKNH